jgi:hypothetical protein
MMERKFLGLTARNIKRMAFELAIENGLTRPTARKSRLEVVA